MPDVQGVSKMLDFGDYYTVDFTDKIVYFLTTPKSKSNYRDTPVPVMISECRVDDKYAFEHLILTRYISNDKCWRSGHMSGNRENIAVIKKPFVLSVEELFVLIEVWPGLFPEHSPNNPKKEFFRRSLIERLIRDMQKHIEEVKK